MIHKIGVNKKSWVYHGILLLVLIVLLVTVIPSLAACEPGAQLIIENRLDIDVTIMHEIIYNDVVQRVRTIAVVPVGETVETLGFTLSPDIIGDTIILRALDEAGDIVWQRSWSFEEFLKLKEVGWKVVVSTETGS